MYRGYASYERAFMRLLFGLMVFRAQRELFAAQAITVPNGLARLVHLDFLRADSVITLCEIALPIALAIYILRWGTGIALVFLALISAGYGSINNSQGAIGHTYQIVSLVLLVQMAAQFCERWKNRARSMTYAALSQKNFGEHRLISWSQQMIVATYVVSGLAKIIKTHGMWFTTSPAIALQIVKSTDQLFYNTWIQRLEQELLQQQISSFSIRRSRCFF